MLEIHTFPSALRVRRRLLWRYRVARLVFRIRHGRRMLALVDQANEEAERVLLFGPRG